MGGKITILGTISTILNITIYYREAADKFHEINMVGSTP